MGNRLRQRDHHSLPRVILVTTYLIADWENASFPPKAIKSTVNV